MRQKINIHNLVRTSCGIDKYNYLKKNKSIYGYVRLEWFLFFATLRDAFKKK